MKKFNLLLLFVTLSISLNAQITIDGLVHHWPLDGNANDVKGNNNGVLVGNLVPSTGKNGAANTAMYFNGIEDYIKILSPQYQEVTIAFWIKPDGIINDMRFVSGIDDTDDYAFAMRYADATIQVWRPWKATINVSNETDLLNWSLICVTIDANKNVKGYFNGVPGVGQSVNFTWPEYLGIGRRFFYNGSNFGTNFKGSMDEFMIFNRVLSPQEIQSLYTNTPVVDSFCDTLHCADSKVGIGTTTPDMKLTVKGNIHAEEVKIDLSIPAPDYVFEKDYDLKSIEDVEKYIIENNHLPEIPSAKEFSENGIMLAEMNMNLLKKIEELTLYLIDQNKKLEKANQNIKELKKEVLALKK
ncbi:LamG domain-containing protein [Aquimarina mytili]|uniref:LamG domain-containing protein n=1 Tax=Aquimarina mytili TaxID=874423 RepID=A0A936ZTU9_9FLAO|nr:LamG domain-containing protein [Aquimarina mytili]MBL0684187.1 hypothetical protein [Aquimarina mytili]